MSEQNHQNNPSEFQSAEEWHEVRFIEGIHNNPEHLRDHKELVRTEWEKHALQHELEDSQQSLREAEERADRHPLTGLPNRAVFDRDLDEAFLSVEQGVRPNIAIVNADLDGFKEVNDGYGHEKGDDVLREVGDQLERELPLLSEILGGLRENDKVYHVGGDEFLIILDLSQRQGESAQGTIYSDEEKMEIIIEDRIRPAATRAFAEHGVVGSASMGYSLYQDGDTPKTMKERADKAMYQDKATKLERLEALRS